MLQLGLLFLVSASSASFISTSWGQHPTPDGLPNFPPNIKLEIRKFENWARDIHAETWYATPEHPEQILELANWAKENRFKLRASGMQHAWSPLTIADNCTLDCRTLLVSTAEHLTRMEVISNREGDSSFWAEPGILMEEVLGRLEEKGLSFSTVPAPGDLTLGGVLAISGHGQGIPGRGETLQPGHTFGSLSNLIISLTAIVYDPSTNLYVSKEFHRSELVTRAFLAHLGRAFITNVTIRAGPLNHYQCRSYTNFTVENLLSLDGDQSFVKILEEAGRAEILWFGFAKTAWLKVWHLSEAQPPGSLKVEAPFNYKFTEINATAEAQHIFLAHSISNYSGAEQLGEYTMQAIAQGLSSEGSDNIWGSSKNTLLFVKPNVYHDTASANIVVTARENIPRVLDTFYRFYTGLLKKFGDQNRFPYTGEVEIRVAGLDDPQDVMVPGAAPPSLSILFPDSDNENSVAIFFSFLAVSGVDGLTEFYRELEDLFYTELDTKWSTVRAEWSKGYGYNAFGAWKDRRKIHRLRYKGKYRDWYSAVSILEKYDPYRVFTSSFTNNLFH